jgi:hypothetical protein
MLNYPLMDAVAHRLRSLGWEVFSPADADREAGWDWRRWETADATERALYAGLAQQHCLDVMPEARGGVVVCTLTGLAESTGSQGELARARELALPIWMPGTAYRRPGRVAR